MNLSNFDKTNNRDEQVMVISNGKGDDQADCDSFAYHAEVTDGYELRVVIESDTSSVSVTKGVPEHFNGTTTTTGTTITPSSETTAILIDNLSTNPAGRTLSISFDGGINFFVIPRGASLAIEAEVSSFQIKTNVNGTTYQIIVTRK